MVDSHERDAIDLGLLEAIRRVDSPALDRLIERYWEALVTYTARLLGDWDAAQDASQETFVRLWERREQWSGEGSVRALLYQIARNLALDERKRDDTHARLQRLADQPRSMPSPADEFTDTEVLAAFREAVDELPERRREVFLLARFDELTHRQIATVMGISAQTVANQLSAALAELRQRLGYLLDRPPSMDGGSSDPQPQTHLR